MAEVWEECTRPDWLFWIMEHYRPLTKPEAVTLAVRFAEGAMKNWTPAADTRPQEAAAAAKAWLANPTRETAGAARVAWAAAECAARAAWAEVGVGVAVCAAADAAAEAARAAGAVRSWVARSGAARAAWAAGASDAAQCREIRDVIPNPFITDPA